MDRIECDRMFVALVETGNFIKAAQRLGASPGQASKLITRLEEDLGVKLVQRTTRKMSLTEEGRGYFERIRTILEELDTLDSDIRAASAEASGRLKLSVPQSFGLMRLMPMLLDFAKLQPKIALDIDFSDRHVNLIEEGFDAALRVGTTPDSSLIARKLTTIGGMVVVASPHYLAAAETPHHPNDLSKHPCIIDSNFRHSHSWTFRAPDTGTVIEVAIAGRLRFSHPQACLMAASQGLGIACVPEFIAQPYVERGELVVLFETYAATNLPVHILYPPNRHLTQKVRLLVEHLVRAFKA